EWIGDSLQATIQHYVKETATTKAAAAQHLLKAFGEAAPSAEPPANRDPAAGPENSEAASR
ncbi:MAG TPA: hypothetical protein VEH83_08270, partial [Gemmatimonadales bacterium]|nr:hypothetical protein [Gemmatimonadales bacterium]